MLSRNRRKLSIKKSDPIGSLLYSERSLLVANSLLDIFNHSIQLASKVGNKCPMVFLVGCGFNEWYRRGGHRWLKMFTLAVDLLLECSEGTRIGHCIESN